MKKFVVGDLVRVGGKLGSIMEIVSINGADMVLKEPNCTFYYHEGDCTLLPYHKTEYVQIELF